jgi:hypothetical protein
MPAEEAIAIMNETVALNLAQAHLAGHRELRDVRSHVPGYGLRVAPGRDGPDWDILEQGPP